MDWIHSFELFLFDFDGLLVNTEHIHYQAYVNVLDKRGYLLPFSFANFCELAHLNATAWKEALYSALDSLDPDWDAIYREKKEEYVRLLLTGRVELMPGVQMLLEALAEAGIRRCVVTHSVLNHVQAIRSRLPILQTVPKWITREDYEKPKPNPECYLKAIQLYGKPGDRIIGFEDSLRGLQALRATPAVAVLVCSTQHPLLQTALADGGVHFGSFEEIGSGDRLRA